MKPPVLFGLGGGYQLTLRRRDFFLMLAGTKVLFKENSKSA